MSKAVNCKTASKRLLSLAFSGKSHANCHDAAAERGDDDDESADEEEDEDRAHALSNIALKRSNTSAQ